MKNKRNLNSFYWVFALSIFTSFIVLHFDFKNALIFRKEAALDAKFSIENPETDLSIVLINSRDYGIDEITDAIDVLSGYNPAVIAVDIVFINDSAFQLKSRPNLVLPSWLEDEKLNFAPTNYDGSKDFGIVSSPSNSYLALVRYMDGNNEYYHMALQMLKYHNSIAFDNTLKRGNSYEYINYIGNQHSFPILEIDNVLNETFPEAMIKGKAVLIGYLGKDYSNHEPTLFDTEDSHYSPIGDIFGPLIIANIFHTLQGNFINESKAINYMVSSLILGVLLLTLNFTRKTNKWFSLIIIILSMMIIPVGVFFISVFFLVEYNYFFDYSLLNFAIVIGCFLSIVVRFIRDQKLVGHSS